jgi:hypothetical protein
MHQKKGVISVEVALIVSYVEYLITLVDADACTVPCIDFRFGRQPVSHGIPAAEAAMFGMKIGGNGNLILMLLMLGGLAFDGGLFMLSFCCVYGMRHDVPPFKTGWISRVEVHGIYKCQP